MKSALRFAVLLWLAASVSGASPGDRRTPESPSPFSALRWRLVGPFRGGRVLAVEGIHARPNEYFFGAVGGGVWKSTDGGIVWNPVFDSQTIASIGAIAVSASNPEVLYVGTGEADMRSDISSGDGIYRSDDGGATWKHLGLSDTRHIGRILVDPRDPETVLVAALGHAYGSNGERGVFRSEDGGKSWTKVLYRDENTGAVDLARDPDDPDAVYASLWRTRRVPWSVYAPEGGEGSGLYRSEDGGRTWRAISGGGFPSENVGRIGIAVAAGTRGRRVYAYVQQGEKGRLYRSDDGGARWIATGADSRIETRGWYFGRVIVDPQDPDTVYLPHIALYRSRDAGKTLLALKGAPGGDDYHDLWIDPENPRRMIVGADQGAAVSVDGGTTWGSWYNQPTAQFYHVAVDRAFPYRIYGAQQDSGTVAIASRSDYGSITYRNWFSVGAGESGYIVADPHDPRTVYGGDTNGRLYRFDRKTGQSRDISPWPYSQWQADISERRLRFTWTSPLAFSPQAPETLYFGSQYVLRSRDRGRSWTRISPDLADDGQRPARGVVYTIAPSPVSAGQIWVGTDNGRIQLTRDGGIRWRDVTPPGLSRWSKIAMIEASRFDAGQAYAAVDRHRLDDSRPHILITKDFGATWSEAVEGIRDGAFVHAVREDPARRGLLYAATEVGVFVSTDDGQRWESLQLNLPTASVRDLAVAGNDLVAATHGRSFWVLDDLEPLRQAGAGLAGGAALLLRPAPAARLRRSESHDTPLPAEFPAGENPPTGAILDYVLKSPPPAEIAIEILDSSGRILRRFSNQVSPASPERPPPFAESWIRASRPLPAQAGLNRFVWDLRIAPPEPLRTAQLPANGVEDDPWALVPPGSYRVRLTAGEQNQSQPLEIRQDPRAAVPRGELIEQYAFGRRIRDEADKTNRAFNRIEAERRKRKSSTFDERALAIAGNADGWPAEGSLLDVSGRLEALARVVGSADGLPTQASREVFALLDRQLAARLVEAQRLQSPQR